MLFCESHWSYTVCKHCTLILIQHKMLHLGNNCVKTSTQRCYGKFWHRISLTPNPPQSTTTQKWPTTYESCAHRTWFLNYVLLSMACYRAVLASTWLLIPHTVHLHVSNDHCYPTHTRHPGDRLSGGHSDDSRHGLATLPHLCHHTRQVIQAVMAQGHQVHFWWVPGHQGITGNERANAAARAAMEESRTTSGEYFVTRTMLQGAVRRWYQGQV